MVEANLPPGFRFHPRDEELVCEYLMKKVTNCDPSLMIEVDLNKCEPWDIPGESCKHHLQNFIHHLYHLHIYHHGHGHHLSLICLLLCFAKSYHYHM